MTTFVSEITASATSHILNTLSTLYANPPFAVMREFIANGIDAHRDAGYDGPVEVTLPTAQRPSLIVKDHGAGMSRDTLVNTYYNYGESTKRNSSEHIGALGLGAKSAYSLSPTWELVSVTKASVIHVVSCINEDGVPEHHLQETPNTAGSETGVTVTIPTGDTISPRAFSEEAVRLLNWLPKGSVTVIDLMRVYDDRAKDHWLDRSVLRGRVAFPLSYRHRDFQVVMGGIPYRADLSEAWSAAVHAVRDNDEHPLPCYTEFGEIRTETLRDMLNSAPIAVLEDSRALDVTTSRDDIKMTSRSISALADVFSKELQEAVTFLAESNGSMESLNSARHIPLVGLILFEMRSKRLLSDNPTALFPYERRNHSSALREVEDFDLYIEHQNSPR